MKEIHDHYFNLAKKDGYVARSAYKLQEIDEKFGLFGPGVTSLIDIGCAPGSWLQYSSQQFQKHHTSQDDANILGFDLKEVRLSLPFVTSCVQDASKIDDVREIIEQELGKDTTVDCIISDMAPDTTSDPSTDARRSHFLIMKTMRMYEKLLKDDGKFAIKVFMGPGFEELVQYCRDQWGHKSIKIFKPKACRKESKETYIVKI